MTPERINELIACYRDGLLDDTLPFWTRNAVDRECGGFMFCLDRDGSLLDTDKGMWTQGRFTWLLATLYNTVEARSEWLDLAAHGVDFIRRYGFDNDDGRMFFTVTREGTPIRKRRYVFTETFACVAMAAYARASGEARAADEARALWDTFRRHMTTPGLISPKMVPGTRPAQTLSDRMITIVTAQTLRETLDTDEYNGTIDECIDDIRRYFLKPDHQAVMETVATDGSIIDHFDGRMLIPGHSIECAWFILDEARHRNNDAGLIELGTTILDWMWKRGWDTEYGGILYFRDLYDKPVQEYYHDMKFWWPQNEAIIATLLAYQLTGDEKYAKWHEMIHDWTYKLFPDPVHGEWYGYLHRDGRVSVPLKGNLWKGPFHLPRMQLVCWKTLEEMKAANNK
ncbi:MAG: N-acylglucosamine 2-epimerase [bacterium]|nr:N-acylglucosamine 2-epimerase [bacterium]